MADHIERILADWVGELPVTIYRGREVTGFAQVATAALVAVAVTASSMRVSGLSAGEAREPPRLARAFIAAIRTAPARFELAILGGLRASKQLHRSVELSAPSAVRGAADLVRDFVALS